MSRSIALASLLVLSCSCAASFDRERARQDLISHSSEPVPSESDARDLVRRARDLATAASTTLEPAQLDEALALLREAHRTLPEESWIEYHAAYVSYLRMVRALYAPGVDERDAEFERAVQPAVAHAEAALERGGCESEAAALLAAIHGQRIAHDSWLGMSLGPKSDDLLERALRAGPENPRAWIVRGTSRLFTPAMFGGDHEEALEAFQHAAELLEHAAPPAADSLEPTWGRAEAHAWLGRALQTLGRAEDALAAYRRALELAPDYGWVREQLIPALQRELASSAAR